MCRYYYEMGELDTYYWNVERRAQKSYYWFDYCKSKLTEEAQKLLELEESAFRGNWRDFVRFQQQKIDKGKGVPSPNRPEKRKNYLTIFVDYIKNLRKK